MWQNLYYVVALSWYRPVGGGGHAVNVGGFEIANVFVQANTPPGNKILDKRGEVLNHWRSQFGTFSFGPDTVQLANQAGVLRVFEVHPNRLWLHFELPDTLAYVGDNSFRLIEATAELLEVVTFTRIGYRVQCVYPIASLRSRLPSIVEPLYGSRVKDVLAKTGATEVGSFDAMVEFRAGKYAILFRVMPVELASGRDDSRLPPEAILIDVDIRREEDLHLRDIRKALVDSAVWTSDVLPNIAWSFIPRGVVP
jgi:hypothetical protein